MVFREGSGDCVHSYVGVRSSIATCTTTGSSSTIIKSNPGDREDRKGGSSFLIPAWIFSNENKANNIILRDSK